MSLLLIFYARFLLSCHMMVMGQNKIFDVQQLKTIFNNLLVPPTGIPPEEYSIDCFCLIWL